jgi:phospholipase/carboxylesterase
MEQQLLECLVLDPPSPARAAVIWLHGLGADGHDFEPIVPELGLDGDLGVRFVFPHAPLRPVTINQGFVMRAWYDILSLEIPLREDEVGLRSSAAALRALVEREARSGIPKSRIVLAGFSQGGAVALLEGLRHPERLAGILALSSYVPLAAKLEEELSPASRGLPVFLAHGTHDNVIPPSAGRASRGFLEDAGCDVEWHEYPMAHAVSAEEVLDMGRWLRRVLG